MLVERIINKVINDGIDIDKLLVVTFTNAAASEMRERILDAIYKKLDENPDSINLQRQITLLNKASICTIHSFCLDVIRNNFYEIDTSANFRIGDTAEIEMLKNDVLEELFEDKYANQDKGFIKLIETYTDYRGDEKLQNIILNIYKYIQSNPFPEKWLNEKVDEFKVDTNSDFANTIWGKVILENMKNEIQSMIVKLEKVKKDTERFVELEKFSRVLQEDINNLNGIKLDTWNMAYESIHTVSWTKWPVDKKVTIDLKNEAKEIRDKIKKDFSSLTISYTSNEANEDILSMYEVLDELRKLVLEFSKMFAEKKKERNMIDFNDIEHFALKILVDEDGNPTEVARKYREKFEEISIDEYQDSNLVQEKILTSISRGNNIFMVGDIKQSIYKFRQARPELFAEKYANYDLKEESLINSSNTNVEYEDTKIEQYDKQNKDNENEQKAGAKGLKIQLFKNFRSRQNVLDITNLVFENIMSKKLGDVEYNESEYLNFGANYPEPEEKVNHAGIAELHIIDLKEKEEDYFTLVEKSGNGKENKLEDAEQFINLENIKNKALQTHNTIESGRINKEAVAQAEKDDEEENDERIEDAVLEARFVAKKIQELLNSDYQVFDKKMGYRKIRPKDVCVLLRATTVLAPIYEKEIAEIGFPVFSDSSSTYLESMEVQTIMSLLKVIDNPMQDIPLVTVLRSSIFGFSDNDLMQIRLVDRKCSFYESMIKAKLIVDNNLRHKIEETIASIQKWKAEEKFTPLNELIWKIYLDTGFYHYVTLLPNGNLRQANLKMLFEKAKQYEKASFKGLFNFINFIDKVKTSSGDLSAAKIIGENDDVIRIMSIHKSKGLEFPVVFLASTGKKFNMQDLNAPILLHQDLGLGPQFIDSEKKIEYSTLAKEAIRIKAREETISEEMRVLYVALTRAKEKLIITGMTRNLQKSLKDKEKILEMYTKKDLYQTSLDNFNKEEDQNFKLNTNVVKSYISYLDWLELVYEYNKANGVNDIIDLHTYCKTDLVKELIDKQSEIVDFAKVIERKAKEFEEELNFSMKNKEKFESNAERPENTAEYEQDKKKTYDQETLEKLRWKYKYSASAKIPTKTSVTKLKELGSGENNDIEDLIKMAKNKKEAQTKLTVIPKFMEKVEKINAAQKGTLIHLCVQKLDEKKEYTKEDIVDFVKDLEKKNIISNLEAQSIDINMLYKYTKSELWQALKQAKEVHKEEPFYINVPAKEIYDEAEEHEMILVQGIIDLYYVDKEDNLILVDYKTDFVLDGDVSKLEEKYRVQLELYKKALEGALNRKVDKAMIWALNR